MSPVELLDAVFGIEGDQFCELLQHLWERYDSPRRPRL